MQAFGPGEGLLIDLRYTTAHNVTGRPIYTRPVAMLQPEAHGCLVAASARAVKIGLCLKLLDAFRPLEAQELFWAINPDPRYTANPWDGTALHPRGVAVDLTLATPNGVELDMGTGFDEAIAASHHDAVDLPAEAVRHRALLLGIMIASGWEHITTEWWHYQLPDAMRYPQLRAVDVPGGPM